MSQQLHKPQPLSDLPQSDLMEVIDLQENGIPHPTDNGGKIIIQGNIKMALAHFYWTVGATSGLIAIFLWFFLYPTVHDKLVSLNKGEKRLTAGQNILKRKVKMLGKRVLYITTRLGQLTKKVHSGIPKLKKLQRKLNTLEKKGNVSEKLIASIRNHMNRRLRGLEYQIRRTTQSLNNYQEIWQHGQKLLHELGKGPHLINIPKLYKLFASYRKSLQGAKKELKKRIKQNSNQIG